MRQFRALKEPIQRAVSGSVAALAVIASGVGLTSRALLPARVIAQTVLQSTAHSSLRAISRPTLITTSQTAAQQSTIAGDWDASYNNPGGTTAFKITFVVAAEKLTGTVHRASGDVPLTGLVKGDSVSFVFIIQYNEHPLAMSIIAKTTGNSMSGSVDFGGQAQDVFQAKRASAPGKPASELR